GGVPGGGREGDRVRGSRRRLERDPRRRDGHRFHERPGDGRHRSDSQGEVRRRLEEGGRRLEDLPRHLECAAGASLDDARADVAVAPRGGEAQGIVPAPSGHAPERKRSTAGKNVSGASTCGKWPTFGMTRSRAFALPATHSREPPNGMKSFSAWTTRRGTG